MSDCFQGWFPKPESYMHWMYIKVTRTNLKSSFWVLLVLQWFIYNYSSVFKLSNRFQSRSFQRYELDLAVSFALQFFWLAKRRDWKNGERLKWAFAAIGSVSSYNAEVPKIVFLFANSLPTHAPSPERSEPTTPKFLDQEKRGVSIFGILRDDHIDGIRMYSLRSSNQAYYWPLIVWNEPKCRLR